MPGPVCKVIIDSYRMAVLTGRTDALLEALNTSQYVAADIVEQGLDVEFNHLCQELAAGNITEQKCLNGINKIFSKIER